MPKKTIRRAGAGGYHFPARDSLRIFFDDEVAFDAAHTVEKQFAVEMIHFMLKRACQQLPAFDGAYLTRPVHASDHGSHRSRHGGIESGNAEAALFLELHAFLLDEFRVDEDQQIVGLVAEREIDDENPERHADLRGGEADARRGVHRLDHVVDQRLNVFGQLADLCRAIVERRAAEFLDRTNHPPSRS